MSLKEKREDVFGGQLAARAGLVPEAQCGRAPLPGDPSLSFGGIRAMTQVEVHRTPAVERGGGLEPQREREEVSAHAVGEDASCHTSPGDGLGQAA